jgi:hypothetical protein
MIPYRVGPVLVPYHHRPLVPWLHITGRSLVLYTVILAPIDIDDIHDCALLIAIRRLIISNKPRHSVDIEPLRVWQLDSPILKKNSHAQLTYSRGKFNI